MVQLSEIQGILKELWNLIVDLNIALENGERITKNIYPNEELVKNRGFFRYLFFQQKFILAVKLCIALEDNTNQKLNFHKLIRRIESEKYDSNLKEYLVSNKYNKFKYRKSLLDETNKIKIALNENKTLIAKISNVRNKNYSHIDPNRNLKGPSIQEYRKAVELTSTIYNRLSIIFNGSTSKFDGVMDWEIDSIIKVLTDRQNTWMDELEIKKKNAKR